MYIASCSFGKDSLATILLALEHNEPLDRAVFAEVMFDHKRGISGEIPEHIDWIYKTAIPKLEAMGVKVDITRSEHDYIEQFYYIRKNSKKTERNGKLQGFLVGGFCQMNSRGKVSAVHSYYRQFKDKEIVQYVGIAADEVKRLCRLNNKKVSLLAKYGYTEKMAMDLCKKYDLVSPLYSMGTRGGCWFCPNMRWETMQRFRKAHPELWNELETLSRTPNLVSQNYKYEYSFSQVNARLDNMDAQQRLF